MVLRAPVGTVQEVLVWLKGLQGAGCVTVADAGAQSRRDEGGAEEERVVDTEGLGRPAEEPGPDLGRPEGGGALIDPRKVNVFLGEVLVGRDAVADEMREEGLGV
jgi:hypothetical protein